MDHMIILFLLKFDVYIFSWTEIGLFSNVGRKGINITEYFF